jgi:hypothetical protein
MATIPQMIPAFAIPRPSNSSGLSSIRLVAIAPKMIANGPRIIPKSTNPRIPQTSDAVAMALVFGLPCSGDVAEPMAIAAVGLDDVAEPVAIEAVGLDMMIMECVGWTLQRYEDNSIFYEAKMQLLP